MRTISDNKKSLIKDLYYKKGMSMNGISRHIGVSLDSVVSFMRRNNLKRRSKVVARKLSFENSAPSFKRRKLNSAKSRELRAIGAMLYWGEGYKGSEKSGGNNTVDFANSDTKMVRVFMKFLRSTYEFNEDKLRVLLYCYSDQKVAELVDFWSELTGIPKDQFSKPYVRSDFKKGRKMEYGLIHVRYSDKKLLIDIKNLIEYYVSKYA